MTSDVEDQTKRPAMLQIESSPTKPAAAAGSTLDSPPERKKSWIIGAACSRMPMPAVTLQNSTTHSSQNCGVLTALAALTLSVVTRVRDRTVLGSKPLSKVASSLLSTGEATSAPPPNPMIARPVARPGRSGNHLISVETGEM